MPLGAFTEELGGLYGRTWGPLSFKNRSIKPFFDTRNQEGNQESNQESNQVYLSREKKTPQKVVFDRLIFKQEKNKYSKYSTIFNLKVYIL